MKIMATSNAKSEILGEGLCIKKNSLASLYGTKRHAMQASRCMHVNLTIPIFYSYLIPY